jgi:hypothetical protein
LDAQRAAKARTNKPRAAYARGDAHHDVAACPGRRCKDTDPVAGDHINDTNNWKDGRTDQDAPTGAYTDAATDRYVAAATALPSPHSAQRQKQAATRSDLAGGIDPCQEDATEHLGGAMPICNRPDELETLC